MKRLLWVIVTALVLVAVVTGCDGMWRYDARLVAADSLMHDHPDSALALVQAIELGSLTRERDRAYRDLLLTQGRYRSYVTATSDSDINRALDYYRRHDGEREKLTRAYIYKGAVMEELGLPDTAMTYYLHAEATAAPDDYFNLGYTKMRIGVLYQDQLSQDSAAIIRLKESLKYFTLINDSTYIITVLGSLGSITGLIAPDTAKYYLYQAIKLAQQFNPSLQYSHMSTLAGVFFYQNDFKSANKLAMDIMRNGMKYCKENQFLHYAAISYLKLGYLDSAIQVFKKIPTPVDAVDSMNYYNTLAEITEAENNHKRYIDYKEKSHDITEQILTETNDSELQVAEIEYNKLKSEKQYESHNNKVYIVTGIIILALVLLIMVIVKRMRFQISKQEQEIDDIKCELSDTLSQLKYEINKNKSVSALVSHRLTALNMLYQDIRIKRNDENKVKQIIPLTSFFKSLNERNEILNIKLDDNFWKEMKLSVDGEFNGIYAFVERSYPNLTEKELKIFCLLCANLSPQIIRLCVNVSNPKTITNYRSSIIKKKMGLEMSFDTFVQKYMNGEFNKQ